MNIAQGVSSFYYHQNHRQVEVCVKFIKCTMKKCIEPNEDIHVALLQITHCHSFQYVSGSK